MWSSELALRRQILAALLALATLALACAGDARAQTSLLPEALAIVAAREGGLTELDRETAEQLYLARRTTLPNGRTVTLVDLPAGPARDQFYLRLTRKNPSQIRAYWSRMVFTGRAHPPHEANDQEDALRRVLTDPSALAYLPAASVVGQPLNVLLRLE